MSESKRTWVQDRNTQRAIDTQLRYDKVYDMYKHLTEKENKNHRQAVLICTEKFRYAQLNVVYKIVRLKKLAENKKTT